ncbi:MAG TPA: hypothetical protein PK668_20790 [Myxococcota bacterium]|nr:hypothetical protein [Myxococcota bacterium]HRY96651.1 hypothetical protein [Myxococcota bacterium]HSA22390.1 hypothetical protein [Myxococcota bacterium]
MPEDTLLLPDDVLAHLGKLPPGKQQEFVIAWVIRSHAAMCQLPQDGEAQRKRLEDFRELVLTAPGFLPEA